MHPDLVCVKELSIFKEGEIANWKEYSTNYGHSFVQRTVHSASSEDTSNESHSCWQPTDPTQMAVTLANDNPAWNESRARSSCFVGQYGAIIAPYLAGQFTNVLGAYTGFYEWAPTTIDGTLLGNETSGIKGPQTYATSDTVGHRSTYIA